VVPTLAQRTRKDGAPSAFLRTESQSQNQSQTQNQRQRTGVSVPHVQGQGQRAGSPLFHVTAGGRYQGRKQGLKPNFFRRPLSQRWKRCATQNRCGRGRGAERSQHQEQRERQRTRGVRSTRASGWLPADSRFRARPRRFAATNELGMTNLIGFARCGTLRLPPRLSLGASAKQGRLLKSCLSRLSAPADVE
jgi:hypothetical protein